MVKSLEGKTIVLGVTGGIAAFKSVEVVSKLRKLGAEVHVIMTKNATEFVAPLSFTTLAGYPTVVDTFEREDTWDVAHVSLAKKADLFVVAPATANIISKMRTGLADDMLSTTLIATKAPVLIAPAMNTGMLTHPATQENLKALEERGVLIVGPEGGFLACGDEGQGRMSEPEQIVERICQILQTKQDLLGKRVLVTAGGTREYIDPVRFIGNESSGKMGFALAEAAMKRGATVTLIKGSTTAAEPVVSEKVDVVSTMDLKDAMLARAPQQDIIIQAAAPADFRMEHPSEQKIKKQAGEALELRLVENPDIARLVGEQKKDGQILVGFAAETEHVNEYAREKLKKKNLDMIVANNVTQEGAGFHVDTNIATLITDTSFTELPLMTKKELAHVILDQIVELMKTTE